MQSKIWAVDFETYQISSEFPFPRPVCLSWCSGEDRGLLKPNQVERFLRKIPNHDIIVAHNLKFDLMVLYEWLDLQPWVHEKLELGTLRDTLISAKLHDLAQSGDLATPSYSLSSLVKRFYNKDISDTKGPSSWRLRYEELNHLPFSQWPKDAVDYALDDSEWVHKLFSNYLKDYDCQTSIRADFVLAKMNNRGIRVDQKRVNSMAQGVIKETEGSKRLLVERGFATIDPKDPKKLKKSVLKLREHITKLTPRGFEPLQTPKGDVATDRTVLKRFSKQDDVCEAFLKLSEFTKLESTYLPALCNNFVRANFNVLVETGRTSSFGSKLYPSCNLQNFPRGMGVRECLVPREGHVFVSIDYGSLELCSVAQQLLNQYGFSTHATQINSGNEPTDLHSFLGVTIYNEYLKPEIPMSYHEFVARLKAGDKEVKNYRTLAKPVGLGFPGGLGPKTMVEFAATTYGVKLSIAEATRLKDIFYDTYPDFATFMKKDSKDYKTGKRRCEGANKFSDEYVYTIGTRTRSGCTFTNFANGYLMQSLSSDGAKIALYDTYQFLFGKGQGALVNFIHDEIIFELKDGLLLEQNIEDLSYIMIRAMQKVMPNIRITVEAAVMPDRWVKDGPFRFTKKYWLDGAKK